MVDSTKPTRPPSPRPRLGPAMRVATALLAVGLGGAVLAQWRQERAARAELAASWQSSGAAVRRPIAADRARRDPDPAAGRMALARVLFADSLHPTGLAQLPPAEAAAEAARIESRLALARELATATLARRPTSWEAALVLGGGRLVSAWRGRGDELYARPERWQGPLRHARRLAPGAAEPGRLIATGTLASWHALTEAERAAGRALLARELRDPVTLQQLLPAWASVAASRRELVSVLPPAARTFELLQQVERGEKDWTGFCAARELWSRHLGRELEAKLARAEHRLTVGDRSGARADLLAVIAAAPLDRRMATLVAGAVERLPAGPVTPQQGAALATWLRWALRLWVIGQQALPPATLDRLAGLASDLHEGEIALAALATGRLDKAELWERRSERMWSEEWAPYAAAKADALLARGEVEEAAAVLAEVHRSYRNRWAYLRSAERLEAARHERPRRAAQGLGAWRPVDWTYLRGEALLEAVADGPARGLNVAIDVAPATGGAVELTWDGFGLGCFPAATGTLLHVDAEVTPAPHLLGVRDLAGEHVAPGGVWLDGSSADRLP